MPWPIKNAAVLGAGIMGAQIAAHLANAGIPSLLLDLDLKLSREGIRRLRDLNPGPFFLPDLEARITPGSFQEDLAKLAEADWIIEAVVERLDIKRDLLKKVEPCRHPEAVVSTNTSGLQISDIALDLSQEFRRHFLGTHFFNPPRAMKLLEIIPGRDTRPDVVAAMSEFGRRVLGKGVVLCKDTPNFIANRIGTFAACYALHHALENGFSVEEVDDLTGPLTGKPKSATFRTLDLVGLDTFVHVADHLAAAAIHDERREVFQVPDLVRILVSHGALGEKSGSGFYKVVKTNGEKEILALDFSSMEYRARKPVNLGGAELVRTQEDLKDRLLLLLALRDRYGEFFRKTTTAILAYASHRIPEVSDEILAVDRALRWGFGWELGPFELWDLLGVEGFLAVMNQVGQSPAPWVQEMVNGGKRRFYERREGKFFQYQASSQDYAAIPPEPRFLDLRQIKEEPGRVLKQNAGASLVNLGDGVIGLEFHSKMNTIGEDILKMAGEALAVLEKGYEALVIGNQGAHFSAGANLALILMLAEEEEWDELDRAVRMFQRINLAMKYASKPVVAAPHGRVLGGGCEVVLHAAAATAAAESYIGLVELGAGVIPAGGGTKEMLARASGEKDLARNFETVAMARVSASALEARKLGFLRSSDRICMNSDYVLREAKHQALSMTGEYVPLAPGPILAPGKPLYANLLVGIANLKEARKITEYEAHLGKSLAYVFCGGDLTVGQPVSEQYILDLERETFLSLCGQKKTKERMRHLLKRGKPLRN